MPTVHSLRAPAKPGRPRKPHPRLSTRWLSRFDDHGMAEAVIRGRHFVVEQLLDFSGDESAVWGYRLTGRDGVEHDLNIAGGTSVGACRLARGLQELLAVAPPRQGPTCPECGGRLWTYEGERYCPDCCRFGTANP